MCIEIAQHVLYFLYFSLEKKLLIPMVLQLFMVDVMNKSIKDIDFMVYCYYESIIKGPKTH